MDASASFKYIRKSADEHIFLPNPYCSKSEVHSLDDFTLRLPDLRCHRHRTDTRYVGVHSKKVLEKFYPIQKRGARALHEKVM